MLATVPNKLFKHGCITQTILGNARFILNTAKEIGGAQPPLVILTQNFGYHFRHCIGNSFCRSVAQWLPPNLCWKLS